MCARQLNSPSVWRPPNDDARINRALKGRSVSARMDTHGDGDIFIIYEMRVAVFLVE